MGENLGGSCGEETLLNKKNQLEKKDESRSGRREKRSQPRKSVASVRIHIRQQGRLC